MTDHQGRPAKPFAYVRDRIRVELREAQIARDAVGTGSQQMKSTIRPSSSRRDTTMLHAQLYAPKWESRLSAINEFARVESNNQSWIEQVHRIAFDDPDARVRGAAWFALARAWCDSKNHHLLVGLAAREFIKRFGVCADRDLIERTIPHWFAAVAHEADRVGQDEAFARTKDDYLYRLAGDDAPNIGTSPDAAAQFLTHPNAGHRIAALFNLGRAGIDAGQYAVQIHDLIDEDPDVRVQSAAVNALGQIYRSTSERAVETFLARIALDESRRDHTRYMACHALLTVRGLPYTSWPICRARSGSEERLALLKNLFRFESAVGVDWGADIDWVFVEQCARGS